MCDFEDRDCYLDLFNQLFEVPPVIKTLSWVDYLSSFKCSKVKLGCTLELIRNLLQSELDLSNSLSDEVRDMDRPSSTLLPDWLLILCEP